MLSTRGPRDSAGVVARGLCMNTLDNIEVDITVELGAAIMPVHHLLRMGRGAVIELDTGENDPLRVYANNTPVSYTHLDVYKRQLGGGVRLALRRTAGGVASDAVAPSLVSSS